MHNLYFFAMLVTTSIRLWGLLGRAILALLMERDFVKTCLNTAGHGVFIALLAQAFGSGLLTDFAKLQSKK